MHHCDEAKKRVDEIGQNRRNGEEDEHERKRKQKEDTEQSEL